MFWKATPFSLTNFRCFLPSLQAENIYLGEEEPGEDEEGDLEPTEVRALSTAYLSLMSCH